PPVQATARGPGTAAPAPPPAEVERPGRLKRDHRRATDATARDQRSSSSTPSRNVGSDNGTPINPCPPLASQTRSATFPGSIATTCQGRLKTDLLRAG